MTSKNLHFINLHITLIAPWLVHGNDPGRFGLDATQLRDHLGRLVLPGSLVQGRIRAAWAEMKKSFGLSVPNADAWFGREGQEGRSRIHVKDLCLHETTHPSMGTMTRIRIDTDTGAVAAGHLLVIEQQHPAGTALPFVGTWRAWLHDDEAHALQRQLQAALLWQSQLGAQRSVGFGEVKSIQVSIERAANNPTKQPPLDQVCATWALHFDEPICVRTQIVGNNLFVSDDTISGGSIKGAIASQMSARYGKPVFQLKAVSQLARYFDEIRVCHAFPSAHDQRPSPVPQSWISDAAGKVWDATFLTSPTLLDGEAPAFLHDWKSDIWEQVLTRQKWGTTHQHLRVRTAINPETKVAQEGQLFTYECRVADANVRWITEVWLDAIPEHDRFSVWAELNALFTQNLGPIGKTDAFAELHPLPPCTLAGESAHTLAWGQPIVLQLNSAALMLSAAEMADQAAPDLLTLYKKWFEQQSQGSLVLSHFFASHDMASGAFLKPNRAGNDNYQPFILTSPGSVFVLHLADKQLETAKAILQHWERRGLPLSTEVIKTYSNDWRKNPYLPENGYGEVVVNPTRDIPAVNFS